MRAIVKVAWLELHVRALISTPSNAPTGHGPSTTPSAVKRACQDTVARARTRMLRSRANPGHTLWVRSLRVRRALSVFFAPQEQTLVRSARSAHTRSVFFVLLWCVDKMYLSFSSIDVYADAALRPLVQEANRSVSFVHRDFHAGIRLGSLNPALLDSTACQGAVTAHVARQRMNVRKPIVHRNRAPWAFGARLGRASAPNARMVITASFRPQSPHQRRIFVRLAAIAHLPRDSPLVRRAHTTISLEQQVRHLVKHAQQATTACRVQ